MGVQVAPILTALGVGGLAVALALRDTLANLFAGIHILVEQPIAVGDYIELTIARKALSVTSVGEPRALPPEAVRCLSFRMRRSPPAF